MPAGERRAYSHQRKIFFSNFVFEHVFTFFFFVLRNMCTATLLNSTCVTGTGRIGVAINSAEHHIKMVPSLIASLHQQKVPSSSIHVFVGGSERSRSDPCVTFHSEINDNVDFNAIFGLCDNHKILHSREAWLYLHSSSRVTSGFSGFFRELQPVTRRLCPMWNANFGVYNSEDIQRVCQKLESVRNRNRTSSYDMKVVAYENEDRVFKMLKTTSSILPLNPSQPGCHNHTGTLAIYGGVDRHIWKYPNGICKFKSVKNHRHGFRHRTVDA